VSLQPLAQIASVQNAEVERGAPARRRRVAPAQSQAPRHQQAELKVSCRMEQFERLLPNCQTIVLMANDAFVRASQR
jgi:hypothetical protein